MPRFMRKGKMKVYFATTIASTTTAPTVAELTAATHLTPQIGEMNGFTFSNSPIQTPDMDTKFVSQIPGEDSTEDSSLVFYELDGTNPIKAALAKDTDGYVVIFPAGLAGSAPAAGDKCEVWPVTVSSNSRRYTNGNEAGMYEVKFACTEEPAIDVSVLA